MIGFVVKFAAAVIISEITYRQCRRGEDWARAKFSKGSPEED